MTKDNTTIQLVGGMMCLIGIIGVFIHISQNDGSLAIAGAIVFASGTISKALMK